MLWISVIVDERITLKGTSVEKFNCNWSSFVGVTWWLQGKHTESKMLTRELTMGSRLSNEGNCDQ